MLKVATMFLCCIAASLALKLDGNLDTNGYLHQFFGAPKLSYAGVCDGRNVTMSTDEVLTVSSSSDSSCPSAGTTYSDNLRCSITVERPAGSPHMMFLISYHTETLFDRVEIYDATENSRKLDWLFTFISAAGPLRVFSGTGQHVGIINQHKIRINFVSDDSVSRSGFCIRFYNL